MNKKNNGNGNSNSTLIPETIVRENIKVYRNDDIDTAKLKENMSNGRTNILVTVRCRPLSKKESDISGVETIKVLNGKVVCVLDNNTSTVDNSNRSSSTDLLKNRSRGEQQYAFDYVFDKTSSQDEVYEKSTKFLLDGVVQGFNATVFAYGATGAGKTYTMLGTGEKPGIMAKGLNDLFKMIEKMRDRDFRIKLIYVEIYNELIRDLLGNGDKNLEMQEDKNKGTIIKGVNEIEVTSTVEVFSLLLKGNKNRATESTNANETSSRSHAVLQITLENKMKNANEITSGKFIMVDLAGSERASATQNTGIRLVEGANINKSLLALSKCISYLVEESNGNAQSHIPWRESKLTRMLKVGIIN
jgi:kinesin family protein 18/19